MHFEQIPVLFSGCNLLMVGVVAAVSDRLAGLDVKEWTTQRQIANHGPDIGQPKALPIRERQMGGSHVGYGVCMRRGKRVGAWFLLPRRNRRIGTLAACETLPQPGDAR